MGRNVTSLLRDTAHRSLAQHDTPLGVSPRAGGTTMRLVHLVDLNDTGHVEPRCGAWGSLDADWTMLADDATCLGCRTARAGRASGAAGALAPTGLAGGSTP